jgi:glycine/D-amino acid oxidase-like deaminating enzyme
VSGLPQDDTPYWLRGDQPLAGFRSRPALEGAVDVLVIGAGLTGASAAYHLAGRGLRVVVVDAGDPAGEASGRNGGNFELVPENSVGEYRGLVRERAKFLSETGGDPADAERHATAVLKLTLRNRRRMRELVEGEAIECDYCPAGWLFLAHDAELERGLVEEARFIERHEARVELWTPERVRAELGFVTQHRSRFLPDDGSYHPFKYACRLLERAVERGVELYTRLPVVEVGERVETAEGRVNAQRVVVATNAFTRELLPDLPIEPYQSQVMVTEDVEDRTRGRIVTSEDGPVYFNQPRGGLRNGIAPLVLGGGDDRPLADPRSRRCSASVHRQLIELRDRYFPELRGREPSAEWIGPMGFTPDQLPAIGLLCEDVVVAAGFNGYGGSYTTAAGEAAAALAVTGETPSWLDAEVFSPARLTRA